MNREDRYELNWKHYNWPEVGDYWHEMFCPYFIVLAVLDDGLFIVCDETLRVDDSHWKFNLALAKQVTIDYFSKVKYASIDGYCADVVVGNHQAIVDEWLVMDKPIIQVEKEVELESDSVEEFNFCIGRFWEGDDGGIVTYAVGREVHYGTREAADTLIDYIKQQQPKSDYKIFRLVEEV